MDISFDFIFPSNGMIQFDTSAFLTFTKWNDKMHSKFQLTNKWMATNIERRWRRRRRRWFGGGEKERKKNPANEVHIKECGTDRSAMIIKNLCFVLSDAFHAHFSWLIRVGIGMEWAERRRKKGTLREEGQRIDWIPNAIFQTYQRNISVLSAVI